MPLIERITVQEDYRPIVNELLGDVLLIPSLLNGVSLWRQNGFCGTFVTPEGDIISPSGILTGGSGRRRGKEPPAEPARNQRTLRRGRIAGG